MVVYKGVPERDYAAETLSGDLLRGAAAISTYLGITRRQAFARLESGAIPAGKEGNIWIASKRTLSEHYRRVVSGSAA